MESLEWHDVIHLLTTVEHTSDGADKLLINVWRIFTARRCKSTNILKLRRYFTKEYGQIPIWIHHAADANATEGCPIRCQGNRV